MNLINCEHPKYIIDSVTGEHRLVPCGKCDVCRGARSALWVERIEAEMKAHAYNAFVSLTYSDESVPRLYKYDNWLVDEETGFGLSLDDYEFEKWPSKERSFVENAPYFNYVRISDFQKFVKRVRRYIDLNFPYDENKKIRYFACSEYGETYLRPHFHCIFFFDSPSLAKAFNEVLHSSWSVNGKLLGSIKWEFVTSSAPSYCAKYCNSTSHLPKVFQLRPLAPKTLCSKSPFVGYSSYGEETMSQIVNESVARVSGCRRNAEGIKEAASVPLWRSFEDYLFPKFTGYGRIPVSLRKSLYKLYDRYDLPLKEFLSVVYFDSSFCVSDVHMWLSKQFSACGCSFDDDGTQIGACHPVESVYFASKRVFQRAKEFNMSLDSYIDHLIEYHEHSKPYAQICDWFAYLEEQTSQDPSLYQFLIDYDPIFQDKVRSLSYEDARQRYGLTVESFGFDFDNYYHYYGTSRLAGRSVYDTKLAIDKISISHKIAKDSRKTKRKNEYMMFRRFEDVNYYKNIDTYFNVNSEVSSSMNDQSS